MSSFFKIGLPVPEKMFEGFYHILALIGQVVSEEKMFEYYENIHVYCPGVGAYELLGTILFQDH